MFSSLEGEAQDGVSKLKEDAIKSKVGLKIILAQLGKKFQTLEILETYKGINYIFIIEYTNKFEKRLHRVKTYGIQMVFFFSIWDFFHEHLQITGLQEKGEGISLTPHYHFHPLHRHLDISRVITAESSPLHIASSRTQTGNLWFPSASR